jgi:hypothetical protein
MLADGGLMYSNTHILDTEQTEEEDETRRLHSSSNHRYIGTIR